MITSVAGAFGGVSGGMGDAGLKYTGVQNASGAFLGGTNASDSRPSAFLNYILFDKNYNILDAGFEPVPETANFNKTQIAIPTVHVEEEGYIFVYLSYEAESNNWVYFDDLKVTHTKSNVIQYSEFYPFGLNTENSWTRSNNKNDFLYNEGSEYNANSGWYETMFRGYDPALGRFMQVDPLAVMDASTSPFAYSGNNPVFFNDPLGLLVSVNGYSDGQLRSMYRNDFYNHGYSGSFGDWASDNIDFGGSGGRMVAGTDGRLYGTNEEGKFGTWTLVDNSYEYGLVTDGKFEADGVVEVYEWQEYQQSSNGPGDPWYSFLC